MTPTDELPAVSLVTLAVRDDDEVIAACSLALGFDPPEDADLGGGFALQIALFAIISCRRVLPSRAASR